MSYTPPPPPPIDLTARPGFPATPCPYCRGTWFRTNLRDALECAGCGAPAPKDIHVENLHSEPGFYINLEKMLRVGIISKNEALQFAGVSTETVERHARE
jgi:hypothetical protein